MLFEGKTYILWLLHVKRTKEKDITEKILADYNDVFADIMNGLLFAGEQRILPEALENTSIHSQYKAEDEKVHELERDVAKYWKEKEVELAICGIENQSVVEKNMPFREFVTNAL